MWHNIRTYRYKVYQTLPYCTPSVRHGAIVTPFWPFFSLVSLFNRRRRSEDPKQPDTLPPSPLFLLLVLAAPYREE